MHKEDTSTDLGNIRIHKNVVASVASLAATEIEGVKRIGGDFKSGILELIGKKPNHSIKVEIDKNDEVRVDIPLVIKYGANIPEVANSVQENVRYALEKMTNLLIKDVNINVQAIERG
ncbi:Asp23/Gls24 family envelope stress response protein [Candidatus Omnitrophota bacterium]